VDEIGRGFDGSQLMLPTDDSHIFINPSLQHNVVAKRMEMLHTQCNTLLSQIKVLKQRKQRLEELTTIQDIIE